ncbi:class II aldolase/adducin family protein [Streptomyces canus]|uniref:class II aldolase/adducin family protein n=1 Tax=Streptomyces canus TaxID=58343 RepID=UPI0007C4C949|nr:class II aldolase/adducin family protein [Streptomyces canus]
MTARERGATSTCDVPVAGALVEAAHVLAGLGLVTAFGHVSMRRGGRVVITPPKELELVRADELVEMSLAADALPAGAPAEAWAHLVVYRARPDVSAIVRAQPPAALAAGAVTDRIAPLHGQAAWLGASVPVHGDARLLRSAERAERAARTLGGSDALVLRGNGALATGSTPGLAVTRMWLLEAVCRTHLAVHGAGDVTPLSLEETEAWRQDAPPLLERLWEHLRRVGGIEK